MLTDTLEQPAEDVLEETYPLTAYEVAYRYFYEESNERPEDR